MFDPDLARKVAAALQTNEAYIEKDWHLVRALGVIAGLSMDGISPALSGGTSLATAWQLIHRFSEDIDFKVSVEAKTPSAARKLRSTYRDKIIEALTGAGFILDGDPLVGNKSQFFRASFHYGPLSPAAPGIRPSLQVEMSFSGTYRPPTQRPVQSLIGRAAKATPEVPAVLCVDPLETAADKVAALAWRSSVRDRTAPDDDPSVVRHLHDLAALKTLVHDKEELPSLALALLQTDARRTGRRDTDGVTLLRAMLPALESDPLWRNEYEEYVRNVSFGRDDGRISFDQAIAACGELVTCILQSATHRSS